MILSIVIDVDFFIEKDKTFSTVLTYIPENNGEAQVYTLGPHWSISDAMTAIERWVAENNKLLEGQ